MLSRLLIFKKLYTLLFRCSIRKYIPIYKEYFNKRKRERKEKKKKEKKENLLKYEMIITISKVISIEMSFF